MSRSGLLRRAAPCCAPRRESNRARRGQCRRRRRQSRPGSRCRNPSGTARRSRTPGHSRVIEWSDRTPVSHSARTGRSAVPPRADVFRCRSTPLRRTGMVRAWLLAIGIAASARHRRKQDNGRRARSHAGRRANDHTPVTEAAFAFDRPDLGTGTPASAARGSLAGRSHVPPAGRIGRAPWRRAAGSWLRAPGRGRRPARWARTIVEERQAGRSRSYWKSAAAANGTTALHAVCREAPAQLARALISFDAASTAGRTASAREITLRSPAKGRRSRNHRIQHYARRAAAVVAASSTPAASSLSICSIDLPLVSMPRK